MVSPLYTSPLPLSEYQYKLLRLHPNTPGFTKSPVKEEKYPNPFSPLPGSLIQPPHGAGHGGQPPSPAQVSKIKIKDKIHVYSSNIFFKNSVFYCHLIFKINPLYYY